MFVSYSVREDFPSSGVTHSHVTITDDEVGDMYVFLEGDSCREALLCRGVLVAYRERKLPVASNLVKAMFYLKEHFGADLHFMLRIFETVPLYKFYKDKVEEILIFY